MGVRRRLAWTAAALVAACAAVGIGWEAAKVVMGPGPRESGAGAVVVFRYENCSSASPAALDAGIVEAFAGRGLECTFGVIPYTRAIAADPSEAEFVRLSAQKAELLKRGIEAGAVDVALHGVAPGRGAWGEELIGHRPEVQAERVNRGRLVLAEALGVPVKTFIPTDDAYDGATAEVLESMGFSCLSASLEGPAMWTRVRLAPRTCALGELRRAVAASEQSGYAGAVIVAAFRAADFAPSDAGPPALKLEDLRELLDWASGRPGVRVMSVRQLVASRADLRYSRLLANIAANVEWAPKAFRGDQGLLYLPTKAALWEARRLCVAGAFFFAFVVAACALAGLLCGGVALRPLGLLEAGRHAAAAGLVVVAVYSLYDLRFSYGELLTLAALTGVTLGLAIAPAGDQPQELGR